ncbi:MAG: hypothetical protein ACI90M_004319, partial [Candidatus Azotimanducaceae bacterium]
MTLQVLALSQPPRVYSRAVCRIHISPHVAAHCV